jgi:hypothetical protein
MPLVFLIIIVNYITVLEELFQYLDGPQREGNQSHSQTDAVVIHTFCWSVILILVEEIVETTSKCKISQWPNEGNLNIIIIIIRSARSPT